MENILHSLAGVSAFALYFLVALVLLLAFKLLYVLITPYNEWKLVKEEKNTAAALGLAGALIGFALALSSAAANSVSLGDFALWGGIALIAQIIAFGLVRFIFMPKLTQRIQANETSAGIILCATSVAVGLLNAACMTY